MDEALLSRQAVVGESSRPSPRREFASSILDPGSHWRQSTARITTTTPTSFFVDLISNLNRKRNLPRRSHSAPSVFTYAKEDPRPSQKSMPLIVRQEAVMMSTVDLNQCHTMIQTYMIDPEKGRIRIRIKVVLALAVVIVCIAVGTIGIHLLEDLTWVDSVYLSVTSVTTVGYGDYAFETLAGRCFAIIWLLNLDNDGSISKSELVIYKLKEMGKIS
ncbi:hypothetical protein VitviT2T_017435 [Vitis vinifera]|uniref:Potassium channel domain-containing protein n=1 Tax=Vitis vinifera TaxID=29760 RepID=A0ABY9CWD3_VITVI|nr:hypothetical protein VitviT2T_017435 [Vitis vinifera]